MDQFILWNKGTTFTESTYHIHHNLSTCSVLLKNEQEEICKLPRNKAQQIYPSSLMLQCNSLLK
uniref:Putative ovule protein n=1 Tax=Solanum chacoense TaxID=4108 RepID=A0A0V0GNI7_SOLCH